MLPALAYIKANQLDSLMNLFNDPINIILLLAVLVVFWRLKAMLGERTGFEKPPMDLPSFKRETREEAPAADTRVVLSEDAKPVWQGFAKEGSPVAEGLLAIAAVAPQFQVKPFMDGAKAAYEIVLNAFARGDKKALQPLLAADVYDSFAAAIDERTRLGHTKALQFVGVKHSEILQARNTGTRTELTLRLIGEVISVTKDRDGNVVEGNAQALQEVFDTWTFERDLNSPNPNWKIIDTTEDADTVA
jgi:predicted lipid-binding transport protein (Tim44 family)